MPAVKTTINFAVKESAESQGQKLNYGERDEKKMEIGQLGNVIEMAQSQKEIEIPLMDIDQINEGDIDERKAVEQKDINP